MKKSYLGLIIVVFAALTAVPALKADPTSFPSSGIDAQSLGRGGTVIACRPGIWSTFGNPATLTPEGYNALGIDYIDQDGADRKSLGFSILDTSSIVRGSLTYYSSPDFAGFKNKMWGVSFSQTLTPSLYLGESYHTGNYEPEASPGSEDSVNTVDAGLLYMLGPKVSVGFVSHNLIPSDRDLLDNYSGFGLGMQFPMTIYFSADYEEDPDQNNHRNLRTGIEFDPVDHLTGRFGYQNLADGHNFLTLGITYKDVNGTLDAAVLYNDQDNKTERIALGLSIRM